VIAIGAIAALAVNWFGAHLAFLGEPVVIDKEDVRNYWAILGALVVGQLATWVGAVLRGARVAWGWHALVAMAGVAAAVLFAVTSAGSVDDQKPEPPRPAYTGPTATQAATPTSAPVAESPCCRICTSYGWRSRSDLAASRVATLARSCRKSAHVEAGSFRRESDAL